MGAVRTDIVDFARELSPRGRSGGRFPDLGRRVERGERTVDDHLQ